MSLRRRPMELLMQMLLATVQLLSLMTVTFFIYRAFDLTEAGYWQIITLAVLLYVSAAYTPLPGSFRCAGRHLCAVLFRALPRWNPADGPAAMALLHLLHYPYPGGDHDCVARFPPREENGKKDGGHRSIYGLMRGMTQAHTFGRGWVAGNTKKRGNVGSFVFLCHEQPLCHAVPLPVRSILVNHSSPVCPNGDQWETDELHI